MINENKNDLNTYTTRIRWPDFKPTKTEKELRAVSFKIKSGALFFNLNETEENK